VPTLGSGGGGAQQPTGGRQRRNPRQSTEPDRLPEHHSGGSRVLACDTERHPYDIHPSRTGSFTPGTRRLPSPETAQQRRASQDLVPKIICQAYVRSVLCDSPTGCMPHLE
jgi:hypothetical protein